MVSREAPIPTELCYFKFRMSFFVGQVLVTEVNDSGRAMYLLRQIFSLVPDDSSDLVCNPAFLNDVEFK